ncbi:MAG: hypothetical protein QW728_06990, partial [Thermoplasmata archaeon]
MRLQVVDFSRELTVVILLSLLLQAYSVLTVRAQEPDVCLTDIFLSNNSPEPLWPLQIDVHGDNSGFEEDVTIKAYINGEYNSTKVVPY